MSIEGWMLLFSRSVKNREPPCYVIFVLGLKQGEKMDDSLLAVRGLTINTL